MLFKDNRAAVSNAIEQAKKNALEAIGEAAVELTRYYMEHNYDTPIRRSGNLMQDVGFRLSGDAVEIGNTLEYAPWVHNGTRRMTARPYLRDAVCENTDIWKEIAAGHFKQINSN